MKLRSHNSSRCRPLAAFLLLPLVVGLATGPAAGVDRTPVITYEFDDAPSSGAAPATTPSATVTGYGKNPVESYGKNPVVSYGKNPLPEPYGKAPVGKQLIPPPGGLPFRFHFGIDTGVYYDDNIYISNRSEVDDIIFQIVPHIGIDIGDVDGLVDNYGILRYSPVFNIYNENEAENTIDHDASFEGQLRFGRLAALGYSRYQRLRDAEPDVGGRFDEDVFTNALRLVYDLSPKTNIEVGAKNIITDHSGDNDLIDSTEWIYDAVVEYVVSDKTRIGIGHAYGTLDVDGTSTDQTFHRPFGRLLWYPTGKLSLEAIAGVDFRDLANGNRDTFVYDVSLQYNPRAGTAMHLSTYRDIEPSAFFEGQNYDTTGVDFKIDQRIGPRWYAGFEVGYEWANYYAVDDTLPGNPRDDDYYYLRPSLTYAFRDWMSLEFWYRYRENDSTLDAFSYDNNQFGVSMNVVF